MPDITDPVALQFSEQYARPMAEMLRWLQATGNAMNAEWNSGPNAVITNTADSIVDSNNSGSPYTGQNCVTIMTRLQAVLSVLNAANAMDGVVPACVRALGPSSGPQG